MTDIETVSIVVASAGVLVGVVYYSLVLRHQSRLCFDIKPRLDKPTSS